MYVREVVFEWCYGSVDLLVFTLYSYWKFVFSFT
jgi:hypothetical protein